VRRRRAGLSCLALPSGEVFHGGGLCEYVGITHAPRPHRIVVGHLDQRRVYEPEYLIAIARSGVMLGFDTFGTACAYDSAGIDDPTDSQRIELLARIVQAGFVGRCVLSHDVGCKSMLRRHGGGYSHLLTNLRPSTLMRGLTGEALEQMFIGNPARWLAGDDPGFAMRTPDVRQGRLACRWPHPGVVCTELGDLPGRADEGAGPGGGDVRQP
jgi:hypothetical protein